MSRGKRLNKFISSIFLICLLRNFVSADTNPAKKEETVQRYRTRPTKISDALAAEENVETISTKIKFERLFESRESINQSSIAVTETIVSAPDPLTYADADLQYAVKTVRRKKQATEGAEETPTPAEDADKGEAGAAAAPAESADQTPAAAEDADKGEPGAAAAPAESADQTPATAADADKSQTPAATPTDDDLNDEASSEEDKNKTHIVNKEKSQGKACKDGLIIRAWGPQDDVSAAEILLRGLIYFLAMCYLFLGIYIATTRFMESIEVITSSEKQVTVINKMGKKELITVRVWNDTVANLTLMALGSSTPEILLSVIEMFQKKFVAGDLGPGTIIGSAAFNLFLIIAVCIVAIPKDEVRRIQMYRVFIVTAIWSIFAYVWLCLITKFITPGVIDLWECLLTLVFFPLFVYHAYITDRRLYCPCLYRTSKEKYQRGDVVNAPDDDELRTSTLRSSIKNLIDGSEWRDFEKSRRDYIVKLKELHRKYPHYSLKKIEAMAQRILIKQSNKSIAFYRIQSSRRAAGGRRLMLKSQDYTANEMFEAGALLPPLTVDGDAEEVEANNEDIETRIYFAPSHYTVMENAGHVLLHVWRRGNMLEPIKVEYYTEDGTAQAGSDYVAAQGVLLFQPGVEEQTIKLTIIDDEIIEDDEHFYVYLRNPSVGADIVTPKVATVMIFDDDHCGIFGFIEEEYYISEMAQQFEVKVVRAKGARGKVLVPYFTHEDTAINGKDFEDVSGYLEFQTREVEKTITINIFQEHSLEKDVVFEVSIGKPILAEDDPLQSEIKAVLRKPEEQRSANENLLLSGLPKKSVLSTTTCHIVESAEFKQTVNKLVQTAQGSKLIGASSWKQQYSDSLYVSGSWADESDDDQDVDDDEGISERAAEHEVEPSTWEYVAHFLTLFWKVCVAIIPPPRMYKGYPCFFISLFFVGICTALLADVALHFGCTLGVLDSVTAICFVAFGTSLPDTFASRIAAIHERTADNAIGNVTGSNAVNVFLGIGVAWTVAVIYHLCQGDKFVVLPGPILFSTVLFIGEAIIAFLILIWRRQRVGGELGGAEGGRIFYCIVFVALWLIYITISSLEAYKIIRGF